MAQDGIAAFEPAFVDELAVILQWALEYIQRAPKTASKDDWVHEREGGSVYLRLSTKPLDQPARTLTDERRRDIIDGGYWLRPPAEGASLAVVYQGVVAEEAASAMGDLLQRFPGAGLPAVTAADRLNAGWKAAQTARQHGKKATAHVESLLGPLDAGARMVTVLDGHPATLGWLGSVYGHRVEALGVEHFGQSGSVADLYGHYRIDAAAILEAAFASHRRRPRG
jgi:pyruvate dehydrogenase E1 component